MSLYGSNLTSVVLLVGRDPLYHLLNRTLFARMCEQSAELHFDSLEQQLHALAKEVSRAKYHCRRRSRTSSSQDDPKTATRSYDEGMLKPGDVYVTCHSNLTGVQVVFHLVADKVLETDDISSRHPCIAGLRNIIKLSSRCAVRTITLPLFLVEAMTESMTVGWCMTRAELVFKCLKGFLMEVCSTGASSSTTGGPTSPAIHYNINFALPSKLSDNLFKQIVELLSTIFHLVPSVTAQNWP
ncbi:Protein C55A6.10 b [Aphelenchoides avenae]|nr:Protein C55A6.10 b [Aphelenchus avenae]